MIQLVLTTVIALLIPPAEYAFDRYAPGTPPDPHRRLCAVGDDPAALADRVHLDCALDGGNYGPPDPPPADALVVLAYNLSQGRRYDRQVALLRSEGIPPADVLLISEADRGCARSGYRHVADDLARELGMNYVYATEWIELGKGRDGEHCEHGNAILSRYPLGNVRQIRHGANEPPVGIRRLGGRVAVIADVPFGHTYLRLYSVHFNHGLFDGERPLQAAEVVADARRAPIPVLVGGDTNAGFYISEVSAETPPEQVQNRTIRVFLQAGFTDGHRTLPAHRRITFPLPIPLVLDVLLGRGVTFSDPGVCDWTGCDGPSDHRPIWATVRLRRAVSGHRAAEPRHPRVEIQE